MPPRIIVFALLWGTTATWRQYLGAISGLAETPDLGSEPEIELHLENGLAIGQNRAPLVLPR